MNPPKNRENSITRYYITEENLVGSVKERKADYDLMAAVMICLGKEGNFALKAVMEKHITSKCEFCRGSGNI